jgi:hypothetical protein
LYIVTIEFGKSDYEFWMMTPRRFSQLCIGYRDFYAPPAEAPQGAPEGQGQGAERITRPKGKQTKDYILRVMGMAMGGQQEG